MIEQNSLLNLQSNPLDQYNEAVFTWTMDGTIVYWGIGAQKMFGYSSSEAVGRTLDNLLKIIYPYCIEDMKKVLDRYGIWNGELTYTCKNQKKLVVDTIKKLVVNEHGSKTVLETCRVITRRRKSGDGACWNKLKAELLLEVAGKLLASDRPQEIIEELCTNVMHFLDCSVFFNYLVNGDEKMLYLNSYGGISQKTAHKIRLLDYCDSFCSNVIKNGYMEVAEKVQENYESRTSLIKSLGVKAYACHPLKEHNNVIGILSFGSSSKERFDKDELDLMKAVADHVAVAMNRIRMEEKIREQHQLMINAEIEKNNALKKAIDMKDEFLSLISHEFKTPITVINSAIQAMEVLCRDELTDRTRGFLAKIKQNSLRQLRLVNNLLEITRISAGQFKVNKKNHDIVFITETIVKSINLYSQQKGVNMSFTSPIPEKIVGLDEEKYERIMLNLLSNAIKFTPKGKCVKVTISQLKGFLSIKVKDEGIGIPKDKIKLIFERFGQVDSSLSRQAEGTGIGLSLVKMLVELLGGSISVKSEVNAGSTFKIILPDVTVTDEPSTEELNGLCDNRLIQSTAIEFSDIYFD